MLVSLLGGSMAYAAGSPVSLGQTAVFDPLSPTESIAYERHEAGYDVSLDREPDNVTMNISAAPEAESDRAAWKARLYVDTGVELMRGVTYRVSYTLSAEQAQAAYDVHFDSSVAEDAYGVLYARSIAASGTDHVEYLLTPEEARGTFVLRLQLGNTSAAGNVLRFANLKVEEASAGGGNVLADRLNYGTKGNISIWTNEDSRALLVGGEDSAKLTVLETPGFGAEVWKIKLLAATGLHPEAGKAYRVRADLAGGESVTVSNIRVEEAIPTYTSALSEDFAFDKADVQEYNIYETKELSSKDVTPACFDWDGDYTAKTTGYWVEDLSTESDRATVTVKGGKDAAYDPWEAQLHILTRTVLESDAVYRVTLNVSANADIYGG